MVSSLLPGKRHKFMLLAPELTCKVPLIFDNSSTSIIPTLGRLNTPYLETQTTQRLKCFQNFFSQKLSYKWVTESDDDNDDFAGGLLHWMVMMVILQVTALDGDFALDGTSGFPSIPAQHTSYSVPAASHAEPDGDGLDDDTDLILSWLLTLMMQGG